MSLCTDQLFYDALRTNEDVIRYTDGRIYNTARDEQAEEEDKIPYIIITLDSVQNVVECKDDAGESDTDTAIVSVLIVADDRESLAILAETVRSTIKSEILKENSSTNFYISDYEFSASNVQMEIERPCVYQTLTYNCETNLK